MCVYRIKCVTYLDLHKKPNIIHVFFLFGNINYDIVIGFPNESVKKKYISIAFVFYLYVYNRGKWERLDFKTTYISLRNKWYQMTSYSICRTSFILQKLRTKSFQFNTWAIKPSFKPHRKPLMMSQPSSISGMLGSHFFFKR